MRNTRYRNAEIIALRRMGRSYQDIALHLGTTKGVVAGVVNRANMALPRPTGRKPRELKGGRKLKGAPRSHPLVRKLIDALNASDMTWNDVCTAAGVNYYSLTRWRTTVMPSLPGIEACFNVLGYELDAVKRNANAR